jgi:FAD binding domain
VGIRTVAVVRGVGWIVSFVRSTHGGHTAEHGETASRDAVIRLKRGENGDVSHGGRLGGVARSIDGRVVLPGSSDYGFARKAEMVRFHGVLPQAVVLCRSPADIVATIGHARRHRLHVAIRSGGHSVAGRSSTKGVVLDVTPMHGVSVQEGVTMVGAGVRLGALYDALQAHDLTIPAGSSHSVGIAGLTLGGGLGILGRKHGLTVNISYERRSSWPMATSSIATSARMKTCSGRCAAADAATSVSSRPSSSAPSRRHRRRSSTWSGHSSTPTT